MNPKLSLSLRLMAAVGLVVFAGCASRYEVKVDAIARVNQGVEQYSSYQLRSAVLTAGDAADFRQAARLVKTALSGHGLFEAPAGVEPDLVIEIDYGMEAPRLKQQTVMMPIYARRPAPTSPLLEDANERHGARAGTGQQSTEIVGYEEQTRAVVVREKYLCVSGRENPPSRDGRPPVEVFNIRVTAETPSTDFRSQLPILAAALMEKLGQTTDGIVTASLAADHASVAFVERGP